ncbi:hypothetical protein EV356DRAFT_497806 [Viridothelium virens]|uniref:Uncharacterized protein n=1 Tax=Viridothelium virens TaxID=1048519 RepID=A0A6A6HG45_VIRVR|nr:hypothetical protein EV356DRAFT_497806 [Viridothelium virens]
MFHIWNILGYANEDWTNICSRMLDILKAEEVRLHSKTGVNGIPHFKIGCYMVGLDQQHACPHAALVCGHQHQAFAKAARQIILDHGILKELDWGFICLHADIRIPMADVQPAPKVGRSLPISIDSTHGSNDSIYCGLWGALIESSSRRRATIGGVVAIGNAKFAVTVKHFLEPDQKREESYALEDDLVLCEDELNLFTDREEYHSLGVTSFAQHDRSPYTSGQESSFEIAREVPSTTAPKKHKQHLSCANHMSSQDDSKCEKIDVKDPESVDDNADLEESEGGKRKFNKLSSLHHNPTKDTRGIETGKANEVHQGEPSPQEGPVMPDSSGPIGSSNGGLQNQSVTLIRSQGTTVYPASKPFNVAQVSMQRGEKSNGLDWALLQIPMNTSVTGDLDSPLLVLDPIIGKFGSLRPALETPSEGTPLTVLTGTDGSVLGNGVFSTSLGTTSGISSPSILWTVKISEISTPAAKLTNVH